MEPRLEKLTCQTNNNTKNVNVPLAIFTCQLLKFTRTWDPTLQHLHSKIETHIQHGTQPCNICISILKHTLDMGSNLAIFVFQIKTLIGLGT